MAAYRHPPSAPSAAHPEPRRPGPEGAILRTRDGAFDLFPDTDYLGIEQPLARFSSKRLDAQRAST